MLGLILTALVIAGGLAALHRRGRGTPEADEPWRASLREADDDEPLDVDAIRRAEEEWLDEGDIDPESDEEPWRG